MSCNKKRENVIERCPLQKEIYIHLSEKKKLQIIERHTNQIFFFGSLSIASLYVVDLVGILIRLCMQLLRPPMMKYVLMITN